MALENELKTFYVNRLIQTGEFERAAAIAVFTLKVMKAIEILQNASVTSSHLAQQGRVHELRGVALIFTRSWLY
jgi:hypothetical protein